MAYKIKIFDANGKNINEVSLNSEIFNDENVNEDLMHEAVLMKLANDRHGCAHTKTRGEVVGSGRKLYRQKGTGRARAGDAASPTRRHGGVAFGPRNTVNYHKDMPKKMIKKALLGSFISKVRDEEVLGLNKFPFDEIKTKNARNVLSKLSLQDDSTLLVISEKTEAIIKSFRNIPNIKYILADYLNPYDLLSHKKVLFFEEALEKVIKSFEK